MKKFLTLMIMALFMSGILHLTFAIHYCGGKIADTRLSLAGQKATCGMHHEIKLSSEASISSGCCDDETMVYSFDDEYAPSVLKSTLNIQNITLQLFTGFSYFHYLSFIPSGNYIDSGPPKINCPNTVSIDRICSYLI